ncbi:DUF1648 domain-containing protein [Streptomyces swartbergensis]|uniref:DUF1648 domain-containing protein n=1 Tax=Streptomyces swartbergensis TaxID=487165 RepID=UPI003826D852
MSLVSYDRLPGRIATHFSEDGGAGGFTSRAAALWFGGRHARRSRTAVHRPDPGLQGGFGVEADRRGRRGAAVTLGYPLVLTVLVNTDVQNPAEVRLPMWHVAVLLLAGVATGVPAWWLRRRGEA